MNDLIAQILRASLHRFIGRLGADPEVRYLESGKAVANARIAVNRPGSRRDQNQEADWFKVEVWGEEAQSFADTCRKGTLVDVVGRVKTESWTDRNSGEKRCQLVVNVESWAPVAVKTPTATPALAAAAHAPAPVLSDEEIPF